MLLVDLSLSRRYSPCCPGSSVPAMVGQGPPFTSQSAIPSPPVKLNISTVTTGNQQMMTQPQIPANQQPVPPQAQPVPSQQPPPPQQQPVPTQPPVPPAQPTMVSFRSTGYFLRETVNQESWINWKKTQLFFVAAAPQLERRCLTPSSDISVLILLIFSCLWLVWSDNFGVCSWV